MGQATARYLAARVETPHATSGLDNGFNTFADLLEAYDQRWFGGSDSRNNEQNAPELAPVVVTSAILDNQDVAFPVLDGLDVASTVDVVEDVKVDVNLQALQEAEEEEWLKAIMDEPCTHPSPVAAANPCGDDSTDTGAWDGDLMIKAIEKDPAYKARKEVQDAKQAAEKAEEERKLTAVAKEMAECWGADTSDKAVEVARLLMDMVGDVIINDMMADMMCGGD